jgi:DNA-binding LytR/AlgR family response regulator
MKVVIIEDEQLSAQRLEGMLKKINPAMEVLAILPSVAESVEWFKCNTDPDLIFMDIHLEDGQCFNIYEKINLDLPAIFTTAYDEYMIRAFKVNSIDYLMKPINYEELVHAIEKYKRLHEQQSEKENMGALLQAIQTKEADYKQRFLISIGSRLKTVEVADVHYFYSAEKVTFLVTKDNQRYPVDFSLDKLAAALNPQKFYRINRQMMLGLSAITNIHVYPKGRLRIDVVPDFKEEVLVSLDKVVEFKEWLGK